MVTSEDERSFFTTFSRGANLFEFRPLNALSFKDTEFFDVILLEYKTPDTTSILLDTYQSSNKETPLILILGAKNTNVDINHLRIADDFLYGDANANELCLRIERIAQSERNTLNLSKTLPRITEQKEPNQKAGGLDGLAFNANGYGVSVDGMQIALTYREFELFRLLEKHPGKVITRGEIMQKIWKEDGKGGSRVIDVHIRRIRSKLGPTYARKIHTIRSLGYTYRDSQIHRAEELQMDD